MAASRSTRDWDPMQEDFNCTNYDSQYPDDSSSELVKLDHCRLYITNVPKALTSDGLTEAFSKFGTLTEVFISKDPNKRYGMVAFETAAEARHAMMKLNKTEPMKLNITIAHEKRAKDNQKTVRNSAARERDISDDRGTREQRDSRDRVDNVMSGTRSTTYSNTTRKAVDMANGDNFVRHEDSQLNLEDDLSLASIDPDLQLELERLQLERLKIQQEQVACKQRMLLKQQERRMHAQAQTSSRCVLPDGKVILRNVSGSGTDHGDSSFATAGGDSLKIPGLQRVGSRACVVCGAGADSYCARCGITPYCSSRCQRRDWHDRHSAVCHNLARENAPLDVDEPFEDNETILPPAAPLRRPRSPASREPSQRAADSGFDRAKNFTAPYRQQTPTGTRNLRGGRNDHQPDRPGRSLDMPEGDLPRRPHDNSENGPPRRPFDHANSQDRPRKAVNPSDKPRRADNQTGKPRRQFDKANPGLDGGRPPIRRLNGTSDETSGNQGHRQQNGHSYGNSIQERRQFQNRGRFDGQACSSEENWDGPQPNGCFGGSSFQDRRQFQHRVHQSYNDKENWDVSKPEPTPATEPQPITSREVPPANHAPAPVKRDIPAANQKGARAPVTNAKPPSTEAKPPATDAKPPATDAKPPATDAKPPTTNTKPPASASDVTPTTKLVPKNCVIETLSSGDTVLLSVDSSASDCQTPGSGFVCVTLHEKYEADFTALCDDYGQACEADKQPYKPTPGETFSYFNVEDNAWYRARCLSPKHCALLDSAKLATLDNARCVRLPSAFQRAPEMSAMLHAAVTIGDALKCVLTSKTANGWQVELSSANADEDKSYGKGEICRWLPTVQYPASTPAPIPEVPRPDITNNSCVVIVNVTDCSNVFVRPQDSDSQRAFDEILHAAALEGLSEQAKPLATPPAAGSYVISKYTDGIPYRGLVKRTNVKQNKYLIEYVDYGNCHVNTLENLCACPQNLTPSDSRVMTSRVALSVSAARQLTVSAEKYLDTLKDDAIALVLSIPGGAQTAPSGSEVVLTVQASKENVNKKVETLCAPDWVVKMESSGKNVVEYECIMYDELKFADLPPSGGCDLTVLDYGALGNGTLSACPADMSPLHKELEALTERMGKYCESELGRQPYLPKIEELCIAQMPPYPQWFRAVMAEQVGGPGGAEAEVCFIDYGNMDRVPVTLLRKMLREFIDLPALASTVEIRGFPSKPTPEMLQRALAVLDIDSSNQGRLRVERLAREGPAMYVADAPQLIAAINKQ